MGPQHRDGIDRRTLRWQKVELKPRRWIVTDWKITADTQRKLTEFCVFHDEIEAQVPDFRDVGKTRQLRSWQPEFQAVPDIPQLKLCAAFVSAAIISRDTLLSDLDKRDSRLVIFVIIARQHDHCRAVFCGSMHIGRVSRVHEHLNVIRRTEIASPTRRRQFLAADVHSETQAVCVPREPQLKMRIESLQRRRNKESRCLGKIEQRPLCARDAINPRDSQLVLKQE